MGGPKVDGPLLAMMLRKRLRLEATTLRSRSNEYKKDLTRRFSEHALELFKNGKYKVILDKKSFTLEEAQESHEYMETNVNIGKIILQVATEEENLWAIFDSKIVIYNCDPAKLKEEIPLILPNF